MDVKIGVSYADDRVLQHPPVMMLAAYVALDGNLEFVKTKLSPHALTTLTAHCVTPQVPSFDYVFELVVKDGTNFKYMITPNARQVIQALAEHAPKNSW